jgi:catechol 2,3-dioxygenase-like lactoylglutathione lyase family enzyme
MKLNHLDLQVSDVRQSVAFFESLFGLELLSNRSSPAIAILADGTGFVLVLQRHDKPRYPEGFHLGFLVDDVDTVHQALARCKTAGYEVSEIITNNRGTMIYCRAADGYAVEVSCRREGPLPSRPPG